MDKNKTEIEGEKDIAEGDSNNKKIKIEKDKNEIITNKKSKEEQKIINFFKSKKGQWIGVGILLLFIIIFSSWIRVQNLSLLVDSTTGEYIPTALDPFYFLRIADTLVNNGGELPVIDEMRHPGGNVPFIKEILPQAIVLIWKISKICGDYSLQYIDVISPVIFYILGLIAFFFLIYVLTNSKIVAILSSFFLSIIPSYLYRTMAGFADHEAIGMFSFFLTLIAYTYSLRFLDKDRNYKKQLAKNIGFSMLLGILTALTILSWGGVSTYLFMIIPFCFFIFWIIKVKENKRYLANLILFYSGWLFFSIIFGSLTGNKITYLIQSKLLSSSGLGSLFVLGFIIVDYLLITKESLLIKDKRIKKFRIFFSLIIVVILGLLFLVIYKQDFGVLADIFNRLLHPFGTDRVGLTVAENKQPYLRDWIDQIGKTIFLLFYFGLLFIGFNLSKGLRSKKDSIYFSIFWTIFISGILFSRISRSSMIDGTNPLSKFIYFGSIILFAGYFLKIYLNKEIKVKPEMMIISSWMFFMLISGRGAIRLFFVVTPFICFMSAYSLKNFYDYSKKSKDELLKMVLYLSLGLGCLLVIISSMSFIEISKTQVKYTGPSANLQWQEAMKWVRENTNEKDIFAHWWDYGYWIQYLGKRPTIHDGGHPYRGSNHLVGRYVLTTPYPETAYSFLKTNNVSYLLIDPTDLGKYGAYSSIGSDENWDRVTNIPIMSSSSSQIKETSTGEIRVYKGGYGVEDDIIYKINNSEIFIPGATYNEIGEANYKAAIGGILLEINKENNKISFKPPKGVFIYNGKQITIPLRYLYYRNQTIDFGEGLNAGVKILPTGHQSPTGFELDDFGSLIYLSPRTINSLFVQMYLLNDPNKKYSEMKLVHSENSPIIKSLRKYGMNPGEFLNFQGFQGPIKIWKVDYPENIITHEEFLHPTGKYAEFDNLTFVK